MHRRPFARIVSTGTYLPERRVTNEDLAKLVDTSDEWIRTRTGIRERRIASEPETTTYMASRAAEMALERAGLTVGDVDAILLSTLTPDHLMPATACEVQAELGASQALAYDFASACSGFIYGLQQAEGYLAAGNAETVLLICAEKMSSILDWTDRTTCVLFGDGAAAVVLRRGEGDRGILSTLTGSDGRLTQALWRPVGGTVRPFGVEAAVLGVEAALANPESSDGWDHYLRMDGREVFRHAVRAMGEATTVSLERAGVSPDEVTLLIPHQANQRILDAVTRQTGFPPERVFSNVALYGNMSSASIPVALDEAIANEAIQPGQIVCFVAFGAGFTWGAATMRM